MKRIPLTERVHRAAAAACATGLMTVMLVTSGLITTGLVTSVPAASAAGTGCLPGTLVPTTHVDATAPSGSQFLISQGLPTYSSSSTSPTSLLVRGKDSLVRLFLSLPSCAIKGQTISVTGASLTVSNGATALGTGNLFTATPISLPAYYTGTPPANLATDPIFVVPGKVLTPCGSSATTCASTAGFTATYTVTLNYTSTLATGTQTATFTTSAAVAQKSNALRILVVPMGNATAPNTRSSQYSANADSAVQQAMNTLSRIYPVPCAANPSDSTGSCFNSSIASNYGGIRYSVDPGMLDLSKITGAYDSNNKFCGGQTNWDAIKAQLAQFQQSFNSLNPSTPADRVIGVADEAVSDGISSSPSGFSCAEGMASSGSVAGWVRAVYSTSPSFSGGVLAMELEHTFGGVPYPRSTTLHSLNQAADGTAPGRGYNLIGRNQVGSPRSVMQYNTTLPWNNDTTILEQLDYQFMLCNLGGPTDSECGTTGTTGSTTGVGAGATFVMSGSTQGTAATTKVVESYYSANVAQPSPPDPAAPNPSSPYRLLQLTSTGIIVNNAGVTVSFSDSEHQAGANNVAPTTPVGVFTTAFQGFTGVGQIALYLCGSGSSSTCQTNPILGGGVKLYGRTQAASPPAVTGVTSTSTSNVEDYTNNHAVADTNPALNGNAVAWVAPCVKACPAGSTPTTIHLAPQSNSGNFVEVPLSSDGAQSYPAWRADGKALVFVAGGNIWTVSVNTSTTPYTVGTPVQIYVHGGNNPSADTPAWSFDGSTIYYHAGNGGLRMLPSTGGTTASIPSSSPFDSAPSASPTTNQVVFVRQNKSSGFDIWMHDFTSGAVTLVEANAVEPAFGDDGLIYFSRCSSATVSTCPTSSLGIFSVKTDGTGLVQRTASTSDENPAEAGGTIAFDELNPSDREVMLASRSGSGYTVTATGTNLTAELDLSCPNGINYPVTVGIPPESVGAAGANFVATYDGSGSCGGNGTLTFVVTDGFARSTPSTVSQVQVVNSNKAPAAAITAPDVTSIAQTTTLALNGSGTSLQDGSITGTSLQWYASGSGLPRTLIASGNVIDVRPPSGSWPCGPLTIELDATDSGGRTAVATAQVLVDCTAPVGAISSSPPALTNSTSAPFAFSASDPDNSSGFTFQCQLDSGPLVPCTSPVTYSGLADGSHTFLVYSSDPTNNTSVASYTWTVDTSAPVTTAAASPAANGAGWNNTSPVTVTLSAIDDNGVASTTYSLSGAQTAGTTTYTGPFTISAQGVTTVTYQSTDTAGNVETAKTLVVRVDTAAPVSSASASPAPNSAGWNNSPVTVSLSATDATSGVAFTTYSLSGAQAAGTTTYTGPFTISAQGVTTVTYQSTDTAGNVETAKTLVVRVDTAGPTTVITNFLGIALKLSGTATDNMSGVSTVTVVLTPVLGGNPITVQATCNTATPCGTTPNPPGPSTIAWTADLSHVPSGTYSATAYSVDVAGNKGPSSASLTINIP